MKPSPADTHVVIAGAGIAGLAAAMILAEAGVRVTLCEAASEAGGKAKSLRLADGHPTEHSLRVYTDTYQTLLTLFSRIPTEHDRTVLDNLVGVSMVSATAQGVIGRIAAPVALQRRRPTFARIIGKVVEPPRQLVRILLRGPMVIVGLAQRGVPATDVLHYLYAHLRLLWMCRERLLAELGDISYADYLQLGCKSAQAQEFFSAVPRIYVAARTSAEAAAIAPIVLKGLFRLKSNCPSALNDAKLPAIMMMDGPTSERMVDPWIRHLTRLGVDIHFNTRVGDLEFDDGRVTALISSDGRRFACDYALLAVPYLTLRELAKSAHVKRYLPQLTQQHALALEASNGIQCFLRDLPATWPPFIRPGVVTTHLQSQWSLVCVLQGEGALRFARPDTQQIELQAGSYLFHAGDVSDALYVVRSGRLQVLAGDGAKDEVVAELGRGQVVGELGVLLDAPRSASVRAVRDSSLMRVTKAEFAKIADAGVLGALAGVLAKRQHQTRVASQRTTPEVVVAVVGVDANAPVAMVATELCRALSTRLRAVAPGRVDCDGLERAEQTADRVVLHAAVGDARWREFCLRVADRVVLVASNPAVPVAPLPTRATGADLVLAGRPAGREHRRAWEQLITPRSMHVVRREFVADDLRVLATRIAGRSVGLVLSGGAARACAHLGVLEELEAAGVTVDRFAGTSMGAIIAALAASGLDAAGVDAQIYEHFVRKSHGDYTLPSKGLIRGKRTQSTLRTIFGDHLVEELPKHFRCVSVDLLARRPVVHRQGPLADVVGCSMRLPFLYAPLPYGGTLHVDGGVLDNVPVTTLVGKDGPLIAVNVASGGNPSPASGGHRRGKPRVPGLTDTLLRTMTISSAMASEKVLAQADLVIKPNPIGVGLMEYHQIDRAREAGRIAAREALPQIMELVHG